MKVTPAMEAGLADSIMDVEWIVGMIEENTPPPGPYRPQRLTGRDQTGGVTTQCEVILKTFLRDEPDEATAAAKGRGGDVTGQAEGSLATSPVALSLAAIWRLRRFGRGRPRGRIRRPYSVRPRQNCRPVFARPGKI